MEGTLVLKPIFVYNVHIDLNNRELNKQSVVYTHKRILSNHKKEWILIHATVQINLENIILSKLSRHKSLHITWFNLYKIFRLGKSIESKSRLVIVRGWVEGKMGGNFLMGMEFYFGYMEMF